MIPATFQQERPTLKEPVYTAADVDIAIARRDYPVIARAFDALVAASESGPIDVELLRRASRALIELYDPNWPTEPVVSDRAFDVLQALDRHAQIDRRHNHTAFWVLNHLDLLQHQTNRVPDE